MRRRSGCRRRSCLTEDRCCCQSRPSVYLILCFGIFVPWMWRFLHKSSQKRRNIHRWSSHFVSILRTVKRKWHNTTKHSFQHSFSIINSITQSEEIAASAAISSVVCFPSAVVFAVRSICPGVSRADLLALPQRSLLPCLLLGSVFSDKKESGRMPGQAAVASSVYGLIAEERTVSCYSARFDNCKLQYLPVISIFCATSPTSFVIPWDDPLSVNETPFASK